MKLFLIIFFHFSVAFLFAQNKKTAIDFIDNDLPAALSMAKEKNKIIFIDAYTTWCGPCKMMDRDVFTDTAVGAFYNDHFVNLKLDMEKGDGLTSAKKYQVRGYPSFLFINSEGSLVHRGIGYIPAAQFLLLGEQALNPDKQLPALALAYARGDRDADLLYNYANALFEAGDEKGVTVGKEYLATQSVWSTPKNLEIAAQVVRVYNDPYYRYLVDKRHLFIKEFGESRVDGTIRRIIQDHFFANPEQIKLEEVKQIFDKTFPSSKSTSYYGLFEMEYYDVLGQKDQYMQKARDYVKKNPSLSSDFLNSLAWNFYEKIDSNKGLKWAIAWAKKSISMNSNHYNNDTLAALYYKLKDKRNAIKYANKAIELAKEAGADFDETSQLIEKINQLP